MLNVLVSGASGIVGYGIIRSLKKHAEKYKLIGSTIYDSSPADIFCDCVLKAPVTSSDGYLKWLIEVIVECKIDILIPSIEIDMQTWNQYRKEIESVGAKLALNNSDLIELCEDKWKFYKNLELHCKELTIPTYKGGENRLLALPFIAKPRKGFGSKGVVRFYNEDDVDKNISQITSEHVMQPLVGNDDEEYTVGAFFDFESQLIDYIAFKRKLSNEGFTSEAEVVDLNIKDILDKLADILKPVGSTNFQFRLEGGRFYLLEINPRISSSTYIRTLLGFNESEYMVNMFMNREVPIAQDKHAVNGKKIIRYVEEAIL